MLPTPEVDADFSRIYEPAEDTYLFLDCLEEEKEYLNETLFGSKTSCDARIIVEIGTGTGIITSFIQNSIFDGQPAIYLTTDLNPYACETSLNTSQINLENKKKAHQRLVMDSVQCSLTSCIMENSIDLLVFNPPYVPSTNSEIPQVNAESDIRNDSDACLDMALNGGDDGMVVTRKLLDDLTNILTHDGIAYILFCARNNPKLVHEEMKRNFNVQNVIFRRCGWEELTVMKFTKKVDPK